MSQEEIDLIKNNEELIKMYLSEDIRVILAIKLADYMGKWEGIKYLSQIVKKEASKLETINKTILICKIIEKIEDGEICEMYLENILKNSEILLSREEKMRILNTTRKMKYMKEQIPAKGELFSLSRYEWLLLDWIRKGTINTFELDDNTAEEQPNKRELVLHTQNKRFYEICLSLKDVFSPSDKQIIVMVYGELKNVSTQEYITMLYRCIISEELQTDAVSQRILLRELKDAYKKLNNEQGAELDKKSNKEQNNEQGAELDKKSSKKPNKNQSNGQSNEASKEQSKEGETNSTLEDKENEISVYDIIVYHVLTQDIVKDISSRDYIFKLIDNFKIKDLIIHTKGIISDIAKVAYILETEDREYIKKCIEDKELKMEATCKAAMIKSACTEEEIKDYVRREGILEETEKHILIWSLKDGKFAKECIENLEDISLLCKANLIAEMIDDEEYKKKILESDMFDEDIEAKGKLIEAIGNEEQKKEWNARFVQIEDISKISLEDLKKLPQNSIIKTDEVVRNLYYKEEYIRVKQAMDEILDGIARPTKGNKKEELAATLELIKRLAMHISYDKFAISEEGKKDNKLQIMCRNLYGGLVNGQAVCLGYANILRSTLKCLGIESAVILGNGIKNLGGHAWNQVKIGEQWYNIDLTEERNEIVRQGQALPSILKSDNEFEYHTKIFKENVEVKECPYSIDERPETNQDNGNIEI